MAAVKKERSAKMIRPRLLGVILFVSAAGCGQADRQVTATTADVKPDQDPATEGTPHPSVNEGTVVAPGAAIANPASEKCVKLGGQIEIQKNQAGEFGVCVFDDGSRCEEWALFRGKCKPGECRETSGDCKDTE